MGRMSKLCPTCQEGTIPEGSDLRALRESTGLTLAEFSKACGWSLGHQSAMERNNRNIRPESWAKAQLVEGSGP
jgi:transcriptional regulator with XRE-family HTH domain